MRSTIHQNTTLATSAQALELSDTELQQVVGGATSMSAPAHPSRPARPKSPAHPSLSANHTVLDKLHAAESAFH